MKNRPSACLTAALCAAAISLFTAFPARGDLLVNFPFDEGTGATTTDTVAGAVGWFGYQHPAIDQVILMDDSPSAALGDRCITNSGRGFLLVDDSAGPILGVTNGPITLETWVHLDNFSVAKSSEGLVAYGQSYKMGMKGGWQVFTLFGIRDITNNSAPVPAGAWTHFAAAWEPGVGVHFYLNGNHTLVTDTNLMARPVQHNLLTIASENPTNGNNTICAMDRVRVHNALLDGTQIDSDAVNPKALLASTLVSYDFNEASFPCQNGKAPSRPTILSSAYYINTAKPVWTNDTPTKLASDRALAFSMTNPIEKDRVNVESPTLDLRGSDNMTNYTLETWVKLPLRLINDRTVLLRTYGPAPRASLSVAANRTLHSTVFGNKDYTSSVLIPNDGRWHHVAFVMESMARVHFYLDGILRETQTAATAAATGDTITGFLIGQENNARALVGVMDRVRIHNSALTNSTLDFPAIPGLPRINAQPADLVANAGTTAAFSVTAENVASYQWYYRTNLADLTGVMISGANGPTCTITNVTAEKRGYYYVVISNGTGSTESYGAKLTVKTDPGVLQRIWSVMPGSRAYITGYSGSAATRDLERGMAYNLVTKHLLVASRINSTTVRGIYIIDPETGAHLGELPGVTTTVTGGTIYMTRIGVADDGAIYACNFGTLTDAMPLKIYRWANETASPTIAYQGNPVSGIAANQQWGKMMRVRGSGTSTEILMDTRTVIAALFTTANGTTFTPTLMLVEARTDDWASSITFGTDNTFWGKNATDPFYQWALHPETNGAPLVKTVYEAPTDRLSNFSFSPDGKYMAGLLVQAGPDAVELYDATNLSRGPILMDSGLFEADQTQAVGYGDVIVVGKRVYALNPNNGIVAFEIRGPELSIRRTGSGVEIYWPASITGYTLEGTDQISGGTWNPVSYSVVGAENIAPVSPATGTKFYQLRK